MKVSVNLTPHSARNTRLTPQHTVFANPISTLTLFVFNDPLPPPRQWIGHDQSPLPSPLSSSHLSARLRSTNSKRSGLPSLSRTGGFLSIRITYLYGLLTEGGITPGRSERWKDMFGTWRSYTALAKFGKRDVIRCVTCIITSSSNFKPKDA